MNIQCHMPYSAHPYKQQRKKRKHTQHFEWFSVSNILLKMTDWRSSNHVNKHCTYVCVCVLNACAEWNFQSDILLLGVSVLATPPYLLFNRLKPIYMLAIPFPIRPLLVAQCACFRRFSRKTRFEDKFSKIGPIICEANNYFV